jgi:imidazolonepropionase-like amidohydrolase
MKVLLVVSTFLLSFSSFAQRTVYDVVINNVNVIDVNTGKVTPNMLVLIKNDAIEITNKMVKIAEPKVQIDGTGKYFMQAMYDMHVHEPEVNSERFYKLQTAAGISSIRIMKKAETSLIFQKTNEIPTMKTAYNFFGKETYKLDSVAILINSLKAKGYDFIKVFGVRDEAFFDAMMKAAKANNIIVCGHALSKVPAKKLLASGYKSVEHVGYFDKAKSPLALDTLLDLAKKNNVFVCPTLDWVLMAYQAIPKENLRFRAGFDIGTKLYSNVWDTIYTNNTKQFGGQEKQYKEYAEKDVANKIAVLRRMRAKGIKFIAGSDAEEPYQTPGFSLLDELKQIQKAGYSNLELIKMVTVNADLFWDKKTNPTDFILLGKNPLADINNIGTVEYVIKSGATINCKKLLEDLN